MNQSATTSAASRLKSGVALLILFPLLTYALLFFILPIPILGRLSQMAAYFSAPGMWILLSIMENIHSVTPIKYTLALWGHYPVYGFLIGFFLPVDLEFTGSCAKQVTIRYGVLILIIGITGLALAFYAIAHDS